MKKESGKTLHGETLTRVSKTTAYKHYRAGEAVYVLGCDLVAYATQQKYVIEMLDPAYRLGWTESDIKSYFEYDVGLCTAEVCGGICGRYLSYYVREEVADHDA
jgi:hypothetical protein